ncbi:MAG: hypothetical protein AAF432_00770 [Planctomycetota bacterium]
MRIRSQLFTAMIASACLLGLAGVDTAFAGDSVIDMPPAPVATSYDEWREDASEPGTATTRPAASLGAVALARYGNARQYARNQYGLRANYAYRVPGGFYGAGFGLGYYYGYGYPYYYAGYPYYYGYPYFSYGYGVYGRFGIAGGSRGFKSSISHSKYTSPVRHFRH